MILANTSLAMTAMVATVWAWRGPTPMEQAVFLASLAVTAAFVAMALVRCSQRTGWSQRRVFRHVFGLVPLDGHPSSVGLALRMLFFASQVLFVLAGSLALSTV